MEAKLGDIVRVFMKAYQDAEKVYRDNHVYVVCDIPNNADVTVSNGQECFTVNRCNIEPWTIYELYTKKKFANAKV
jgi:hypothetical protein